jgi:hypothetical protein
MKCGIQSRQDARPSPQIPASLFSETLRHCGRKLRLLHLRILRLGLLQDGDVGVGVFPELQAALGREADAAQEVIEAGVGAQGIPDGVDLQEIERS